VQRRKTTTLLGRPPAPVGILIAITGALLAQGIATTALPTAPKASASGKPWPVKFTDVAASAGLGAKSLSGNPLQQKFIIEANGSGVAFLDFDGDDLLDVLLLNGQGAPFLYRNAGHGKFTEAAKLSHPVLGAYSNGVCAGDVDNDGHTDLYLTYWGASNVLYRNTGKGAFEDVTRKFKANSNPKSWSTGCTFIDYDRDGHLDLFFASYAGFDPATTPLPGAQPYCTWKGAPVFCGPRGLPYGTATMLHNRGDGTFEDATAQSKINAAEGFYAFTVIAADLDNDAWPDLYVASDSTPSLFFRNNRDGTFTELATEAGLAFNEHGSEQAGMGLAAADLNHDGRLDILKTNFSGDYPNLYRNLGKGVFTDIPLRAGLAVNPNYVLWGAGFVDLDNDGERDLFLSAGHVFLNAAQIDPRDSFKQKRLVYRNLGNGIFEDVSPQSGLAISTPHSSRGTAFGDFDNDGDVDVLIFNLHEGPSLLRNDAPPGQNNWIKIDAGVGALVTIETASAKQSDIHLSQSSFLSVNDPRLHFGLGAAKQADRVTVLWPNGKQDSFGALPAGTTYKLKPR
jgi:enediyne biosynthesis protein E4